MLPTVHPLALHIISLDAVRGVGIPIAVIGAVFLSLGAQFQSQGVGKVDHGASKGEGLGGAQLLRLLKRPSWVFGTVMLGLAIVLQITALRFAPLIVVQPVGVVALVTTAFLNSRVSHTHLNRRAIRSIVLCVGGVGVFVTVAASTATDPVVQDRDLVVILLLLAGVLVVFTTLFLLFRKKMTPITYIIGAGVCYGFVASIAKTVLNRVVEGQTDWLTILCVIGLLTAGGAGLYLVQTAYSVGPPDLVIAGLTVVDPIVAVSIGIVVLGEATGAPWWAPVIFVLSGAVAVFGVFQLSRYHPQVRHSTVTTDSGTV